MNYLYVLFIFIFLNNLDFIFAYSPEENTCLVNLLTKLDLISDFPPTLNGNTEIDFCSFIFNFSCSSGTAGSYSGVHTISLKQPDSSTNLIYASDVTCGNRYFVMMHLTNWKLSSTFFDLVGVLNVDNLILNECYNVEVNQNFANVSSLSIYLREPLSTPILLSNILTVDLYIGPGISTSDYSNSAILVNDFPDGHPFVQMSGTIAVTTRSIPPMKDIHCGIMFFTFGYPFNYTSLINLSTYTHIGKVSFRGEPNVEFPFVSEAFYMGPPNPSVPYIHYGLETIYKIEKPIDYLDFKNSTNSAVYLELLDVGPNFNIRGEIPFINLPSILQQFIFTGGNISSVPVFDNYPENLEVVNLVNNNIGNTLPNWNRTRILNLILADNNITGTIDDSYCSVLLDVRNNKMSGPLPTCYQCNLNSIEFRSNFLGKDNFFSNINDFSTNCVIIPNLKIYSSIFTFDGVDYIVERLVLFGSNLGYGVGIGSSSDIELVPSAGSLKFEIQNHFLSGVPFNYNFKRTIHKITFTLSGKEFYLTPDPYQPTPYNATFYDDTIYINGIYFSYNTSVINVSLNDGEKECFVTVNTFYYISCQLTDGLPTTGDLNNVSTILTVDGLSTLFYIDLGDNSYTQYTSCLDYCNIDNGVCNYTSGQCNCNIGWTGENCSIVFFECPDNCSGFGTCSNQTGICDCQIDRWYDNCSGVNCLDPTCDNGNGNCNYSNGTCECDIEWNGVNCTTPMHSVSSVIPSTVSGGLVVLIGWFGDIHTDLEIKIGSLICNSPTINSTTIECLIGAGDGIKNITVIQNGITWIGTNKFLYIDTNTPQKCLNDCIDINHGICNTTTGQCICEVEWNGIDCSSPDDDNNPNNNSTITNGTTVITNQQTSFEIQIIKLLEIDLNGNLVDEYQLQNNWIINNTISNSSSASDIYQFTQILNNTHCKLKLIIEQVKMDKRVNFAGIELNLESGSIKVSISIENYQYKSNLNTLQLQLKSKVSTLNQDSDCNDSPTETTSNLDSNLLNYISIGKNNKKLFGRFINRVISDGYSTFITTSLISNNGNSGESLESIIVGLNLPHFKESILIDPDFSVLLTPEFKSTCDKDDNKNYVIPVAVVVSVFGVSLIVVSVYWYLKRKKDMKFMDKIRLSSLNRN